MSITKCSDLLHFTPLPSSHPSEYFSQLTHRFFSHTLNVWRQKPSSSLLSALPSYHYSTEEWQTSFYCSTLFFSHHAYNVPTSSRNPAHFPRSLLWQSRKSELHITRQKSYCSSKGPLFWHHSVWDEREKASRLSSYRPETHQKLPKHALPLTLTTTFRSRFRPVRNSPTRSRYHLSKQSHPPSLPFLSSATFPTQLVSATAPLSSR